MTTKHCLIYGGAFNPPTNAHRHILQACIDRAVELGDAEVWLLPSGENNRKKTGIDTETRITFCEALIESVTPKNTSVRIERIEIDDTQRTIKTETVQRLQSQYPDMHFIWVYGADSLKSIDAWGGDWLKEHTDMLITPRAGATIDQLPARAQLLEVPVTVAEISSTLVRTRVSLNEPIDDLVPPRVLETLRTKLHLYR